MFKVGDTVKIVKKVKDYSGGWNENMDDTIGEKYIIQEIDEYSQDCLLSNDYWYPFESIVKCSILPDNLFTLE